MIVHLCNPKLCWLKRRDTLFNNSHIHDFPQHHFIRSDEPVDDIILKTGMVTSKAQLKRLYKQGAVKVSDSRIQIGQRILILVKEQKKEMQ